MSKNPVDWMQLWVVKGTGNQTAALDSDTDTITLTSGLWYVWATQTFKISWGGAALGDNPGVFPPNTMIPIHVGEDNISAFITRLDTDGNYYFNKVIQSEY
jgi:hypothetical protein